MKVCPGIAVLLTVATGGCDRRQPSADLPARAAASISRPADGWIGKWVGVEGLALDIAPRGAAGRYLLTVHLMDGVRQFAGEADAAGIRFTRDGRPETVRHVPGSMTGLKWLAERQDCLMIRPGEGFCRR